MSTSGRLHQSCSLPLSPTSDSNYSSSSISDDSSNSIASVLVDGVELHSNKTVGMDSATSKIRSFFLDASSCTSKNSITKNNNDKERNKIKKFKEETNLNTPTSRQPFFFKSSNGIGITSRNNNQQTVLNQMLSSNFVKQDYFRTNSKNNNNDSKILQQQHSLLINRTGQSVSYKKLINQVIFIYVFLLFENCC